MAKGYEKNALAAAEQLLAAEDEQVRLAALLAKKQHPVSREARAKLVASLLRYGYALSLIEKMI